MVLPLKQYFDAPRPPGLSLAPLNVFILLFSLDSMENFYNRTLNIHIFYFIYLFSQKKKKILVNSNSSPTAGLYQNIYKTHKTMLISDSWPQNQMCSQCCQITISTTLLDGLFHTFSLNKHQCLIFHPSSQLMILHPTSVRKWKQPEDDFQKLPLPYLPIFQQLQLYIAAFLHVFIDDLPTLLPSRVHYIWPSPAHSRTLYQ